MPFTSSLRRLFKSGSLSSRASSFYTARSSFCEPIETGVFPSTSTETLDIFLPPSTSTKGEKSRLSFEDFIATPAFQEGPQSLRQSHNRTTSRETIDSGYAGSDFVGGGEKKSIVFPAVAKLPSFWIDETDPCVEGYTPLPFTAPLFAAGPLVIDEDDQGEDDISVYSQDEEEDPFLDSAIENPFELEFTYRLENESAEAFYYDDFPLDLDLSSAVSSIESLLNAFPRPPQRLDPVVTFVTIKAVTGPSLLHIGKRHSRCRSLVPDGIKRLRAQSTRR